MRILRASMYPPGGDPPVMMVMRESDLQVSIEEAAKVQAEMGGAFVITDIFELPGEPTIEEATFKAVELQEAASEREQDMALTYYYDADALNNVMAGGVLTMTRPAPLSADDLAVPLRQLVNHPNYRQQVIVAISHDHKIVELRDGEIKVTTIG